jgi:hypothetical protein
MRNKLLSLFVLCFLWTSCKLDQKGDKIKRNPVFTEYHSALDSIIVSNLHLIRQCELGSKYDSILQNERLFHANIIDQSDTSLYCEYLKQDSTFTIKMNYHFDEERLTEAEIIVQHKDYNQMQLIYFNTILFYTKKLGEPLKDKGYFVFKQKKKDAYHILAVTDDSDNLNSMMRIQLYKEF